MRKKKKNFLQWKWDWLIDTYEAVAIVCCGVTGGVCGSCLFSVITKFFVVEPFQEEFVGGNIDEF